MKKAFKIFAFVLGVAALCSCSKEYLNLTPTSSTTEDRVFETTQSAAMAINGMCRLQCNTTPTDGQNGEGSIISYYGNYPGQHFQKCNRTSISGLMNNSYHLLLDSSYDIFPWYYYYTIISNANRFLEKIDGAKGPDEEKTFMKAQALTLRAWSYFRLSELYANRWIDSKGNYPYKDDNGDDQVLTGVFGVVPCVPLRLDTSTGPIACAYLRDVRDRVYADLDTAIAYYQASGLDRESHEFYKPNLDVAYAIYTRALMTLACPSDPESRWQDAIDYARLARANYPLMSNTEYCESGFNTRNQEWIWGVYDATDQNNLGTNGFYGYMASNGISSNCITYPSAISKELYDKIPGTDVRKKCYLEPHAGEIDILYYPTTGRSIGPLAERAKREYGDKLFIDKSGQLISSIYVYMQFKFQAAKLPAVGCIPLIRSAEMMYLEAEALYYQGGHDAEIQALLNQLNAERDPSYNCTATGANLLTEIKTYKAFDMWGEGLDWFDLKRWKETLKRKSLANGGSFHATFAVELKPTGANKWTWTIPRKERDYNPLVKILGGLNEDEEPDVDVDDI